MNTTQGEDPYVQFTEFYKKVGGIQFSLLKNQEIVDISTIQVKEARDYDRQTQQPLENGVLDLRLGSSSSKFKQCQTCFKQSEHCPGHYGYLKMALPVFHIGYFKHTLNILQIICKSCSKPLLDPPERELFLRRMKRKNLDRLQRLALFKKIIAQCKKMKICHYCKSYNGTVKKLPSKAAKIIHVYRTKPNEEIEFPEEIQEAIEKNQELRNSFQNKKQDEINPLQTYQLFSRIHDDDAYLLAIDPKVIKPVDFLVTHILAPPNCVRPTVHIGATLTREDELTIKLMQFVGTNNEILLLIKNGAELSKINEAWYKLQALHSQFINSETPGLPLDLIDKSSGGLSQRLKGKHGRFRGNLSGKRVNFSGRTVISPDPNIGIHQVCVPIHMARELTYPEKVNKQNFKKMKQLVLNGPEHYPGARYINQLNGSKVNLSYGSRKLRAEELKIGDVVERHLLDGDIVLFNRQPSLHRLSIMAHRAKVLPWRTLRFNECVCTPYNADFDGDEMNIHVPQTEEARAEALYLMGVHNNLLTPKNGQPIIALTQDFLTCSFLMTHKERFFDRAQFSQICAYLSDANEHIDLPPPTIMKPIELWTGKQVINVILCPNRRNRILINVNKKESTYTGSDECFCPNDGWVLFHNSELLCGRLGKSTLGSGTKGGLFYSIIKDNSSAQAAKCMNKFAKLSARWLSNYGVTFGLSDVTPDPNLIKANLSKIEAAYEQCNQEIEKLRNGTLELMPGCSGEQTLENKMNGILSKVREQAGAICMKELPSYNPPLIMATCGSKGSKINLSQMIACVGQQVVGGSRIPNSFTNRTMPHFEKHSKRPAAKGFVKNSFYTGLTGPEFFFHTMGGREGLIDTAVKTADTGYMQRRLMKALEDLAVNYDYTVRTCDGQVVQFMYGEDGMEPMMMEDGNKPLNFERLMKLVKGVRPYKPNIEKSLYPYEIRALFERRKKPEGINDKIVSPKFKEDMEEYTQGLIQELSDLRHFHGLPRGDSKEDIKKFGMLSESLEIEQRIVDNVFNLTERQLEMFYDKVWERYAKAMITPAEAVGAVTAQSIGEPGTQMTLKTFHFAGVASMNVTLGVPRIKEIINAAKNISTPIITTTLNNKADPVIARMIKGRIEKTILGDICKSIKEVYSPKGCYLSFKLDIQAIESLKLDIDANTVKEAILKTSRIKLKDQHVEVINAMKFTVEPYDTSSDGLYFVLQLLKRKLPQVIVKGIPTVNRAIINKKDFNDKPSEYNLLVEGYGLRQVMNIPGVNGYKTKTNHIMETEKILGIEAARRAIDDEIKYILESHSMVVDHRHIGLLADIMTYKGTVLGITRFGITKMKDSTLTMASFEKTADILFDSAILGRKEEIKGVSDCIILGDSMQIGTGMFKLLHDHQKEKNAKTNKGRKIFDWNSNMDGKPILG